MVLAYIILADGEFDQVVETTAIREIEIAELKRRNARVSYVTVPWEYQDLWIDTYQETGSKAKARKAVANAMDKGEG